MSDSLDVGRAVDIVVVEDAEDDARITMRGLRQVRPELSVEIISDGAAAIDRLTGTTHQPRVVFLDLKLPKAHGLQVLEAVKRAPNSKDTPIVVLTSSDEMRDIARARELGCADYLTKPIDWTAYVRLVCTTAIRYFPGSECVA